METSVATGTRSRMGKVVGAGLIGTTIEAYDFLLYGLAAALVFNTVFFPTSDPLTGTLLAFGTYAVGFLSRPIGAIVFGHYGDRVGRKPMLSLSLLIMGVATVAIGLLPSYATIGVAAPILLTLLRLVQGFTLGGEWGGAVVLLAEHGGDKRRAFWACWPQVGAPLGNLLASGVLAVLSAVLTPDAFTSWGWRVAFLLSGVLVLIGLWVRRAVDESPVFLEARTADATARRQSAIVTVVRRDWRHLLIGMGLRFAENVAFVLINSFLLVYITTFLGLPRGTALTAVLIGAALHAASIPLWATLSDRIGRRPVYLVGAAGLAAWAFPMFALLNTRSTGAILTAVVVALVLHGAMFGPQAAFLAELFGTGVRYSGASLSFQLVSIVAGSVAPLVAVALLQSYGSGYSVATYLVLAAIITIVAVWFAPETRDRRLEDRSVKRVGV